MLAVLSLSACNSGDSPENDGEASDSTQTDDQAGWIDLFNGENFDGWTQRGGEAKYTVENGEVVGTTVAETPNSFMCTEKNYSNFVLELDVKVDTALNSGIQIRSNSLPEYKDGRVHGYQIEIDPSDRAWSGGLYDEARRGWLDDLSDNDEGRKAFKNHEWNHYKIYANGDTIRSWVNGVQTANFVDTTTTETGFIGLQVHGVNVKKQPWKDGVQVRWKNIKLKEL